MPSSIIASISFQLVASQSAGRQWSALLFCPALSVSLTPSALYHIPRRSALGLEDDENQQWLLTSGIGQWYSECIR